MSFFGFGQSVDVDILLNDADSRRRAEHKTEDGKKDKYFLFYDGETVSGKVSLALKNPNKRLEHQGIKVEFIGQIGPVTCCPPPWVRAPLACLGFRASWARLQVVTTTPSLVWPAHLSLVSVAHQPVTAPSLGN